MGTWGSGAFANDEARDLLQGFLDNPASTKEKSLVVMRVLVERSDLQADDCQLVIALAEMIAARTGHPSAGLPEDAQELIASSPAMDFEPVDVELAKQAVAKIMDRSELSDLWRDSPNFDDWRSTLSDLHNRLTAGV